MTSQKSQREILVTGGAGFIGSHLVNRLIERGDHVVVVDDLSTGCCDNLNALDSGKFTLVNSRVGEAIREFTPGRFAEIYHLAAAVGVRLVIEQPIHTIETNVLETSAILKFAAESSTPILLASSSEIYGKSTHTPFSEDDDVVYGPTIYSRWSYACSKAIDEYLALAYFRQVNLPVVIARFFNTVGPRQVGSYGMVLPRFINAAMEAKPIEVYGDGKQTRCFCDVRDVAEVLPRLLECETCRGRVVNVGRDDPIQINHLAELVIMTLNSTSTVVHVSYEKAFGPDFDDLRDRRPDVSRLCEAVGFSPMISLQQTIQDMAAEIRTSTGKQTMMESARR